MMIEDSPSTDIPVGGEELILWLIAAKRRLAAEWAYWSISGLTIEEDIVLTGMALEEEGHHSALGASIPTAEVSAAAVDDPSAVETPAPYEGLRTWSNWRIDDPQVHLPAIDDWSVLLPKALALESLTGAAVAALRHAGERLSGKAGKILQEEVHHLSFILSSMRTLAEIDTSSKRQAGLVATYHSSLQAQLDIYDPRETISRLEASGELTRGACESFDDWRATVEADLGEMAR